MYKKFRQENELFLMYLEYEEPITREWSITGPLMLIEASKKGLTSLNGSTVYLCLRFLHIYGEKTTIDLNQLSHLSCSVYKLSL